MSGAIRQGRTETRNNVGSNQGELDMSRRAISISIFVLANEWKVGPDQQLNHVRKTLGDKYKIKVEQLGLKEGQKREVRILNKVGKEQ